MLLPADEPVTVVNPTSVSADVRLEPFTVLGDEVRSTVTPAVAAEKSAELPVVPRAEVKVKPPRFPARKVVFPNIDPVKFVKSAATLLKV